MWFSQLYILQPDVQPQTYGIPLYGCGFGHVYEDVELSVLLNLGFVLSCISPK